MAQTETSSMGGSWGRNEVVAIVADYFEMLAAELQGEQVNKTEHRNRLSPHLLKRSKGSIEFKHQNISAVLISRGLPYIDGYKPRGNFQKLLAEGVDEFIHENPSMLERFSLSPVLNPAAPTPSATRPVNEVFVPPPERIITPEVIDPPWKSRRGRKTDFALRDAQNRRLGRMAEEFVLGLEQRRLNEAGRDDLAARVEWIADTCGDGIGFDVLSFNEKTDVEKWVEVKATGLGKYFPFYVSMNEVRCSEAEPNRYHLFQVFDFSKNAQVYVLTGALSSTCQLDPVNFLARF